MVAIPFFVAAALLGQAHRPLASVETKYYVVETDLPADRAKFIERVMDAAGLEYSRRFQGFRGVVRRKPRIKVFADRENYLDALRRATESPQRAHRRGVYVPLDGFVYTYEGPALEDVLKHECFHQFADLVVGGDLPTWVNEGLAEYFEAGEFEGQTGKLRLGTAPALHVRILRLASKEDALLPVDRLMALTGRDWSSHIDNPVGHLQYAQAWALCHFLIHAEHGKYAGLFDTFLRHVDRGLDGDTAFGRVFGADTAALQAKYEAYVADLEAPEPDTGDQPER